MAAAAANVQRSRMRFEMEFIQNGLANRLEHCFHQCVISNPIAAGLTIPEFDLAFILHDVYFA
jgi:hypothetical protein